VKMFFTCVKISPTVVKMFFTGVKMSFTTVFSGLYVR
jgi:hypothetical protein